MVLKCHLSINMHTPELFLYLFQNISSWKRGANFFFNFKGIVKNA